MGNKGSYITPLLAGCLLFGACTEEVRSANPAKPAEEFYTADDFNKIPKVDAHVHVNTYKPDYLLQAAEDDFRLITINLDDVHEPPPMEEQQQYALHQIKAFPGRIAYATTISIRNFNQPDWLNQTLAYLQKSFEQGAIAVKIYKVIGMSLRDSSGKLVMIDDPRFDPVIDFIIAHHIPILGHLAEPKNCWLPVEEMTIKGDKQYFTENPLYHMYRHPEFPSYEAQIAARDHMLEKHPDLKFIGAHLGSLEWDVDELAKRLDKFPNMAVDMAARIPHLQYQAAKNWRKVHDFIIKYQDRLLYATDDVISTDTDPVALKKRINEGRKRDWEFFTSHDPMTSLEFEQPFNGLQLPRSVVDKIYRLNAEQEYPGISAGEKTSKPE